LNTVVVDVVVTVVMSTPHVLTANMPSRNIDSSNNVHIPGQLFRCQYLRLDKPVQILVRLQLHILPWIPKSYHENAKLILVCGMECCPSFSRTLKRGKRHIMHIIQDHESSHPAEVPRKKPSGFPSLQYEGVHLERSRGQDKARHCLMSCMAC